MFGFFKRKADVFTHWYSLVPDFTTSAQEFYAGIEQELKDRLVPSLEISRVDFAEGGMLSDKRTYLRMLRERLVFDICAAPFGTRFFFSCRFAEIPTVVKLWHLLVLFIGFLLLLGISFAIFSKIFGDFAIFLWPLAWVVFLVFAIYAMRNAVSAGFKDLDSTLLRIPVINAVYGAWFRKETYYRHDTRLMYFDTVNSVVKAHVEHITGAKGIKFIRFNEHDPILGELYKSRTVRPGQAPPDS